MCMHQRKTNALRTDMGKENCVSLENRMFPCINFWLESTGTPSSPSSSVSSDHPALTARVVSTLLQPSTVSSTHLSAHPSSASPSETPNPFILYLSADEVVKLSFIPLPCPPLSLPLWQRQQIPLFCSFFRSKLVKTKEILKSPVSFWLHPPFSAQTCLTLPSKSPSGLHSFTAACHVLMLKTTKMPISHHSGWEQKPIHQQWKTFIDTFATS